MPTLGRVGDLALLLSRLPQHMPLVLDAHVRAAEDGADGAYTVTPRLVDVVLDGGTDSARAGVGLQLGMVLMRAGLDEGAQADLAGRRDLPPRNAFERARHLIDRGHLRQGLTALAEVQEYISVLLDWETARWLENGDLTDSLGIEALRAGHTADRLHALAGQMPR
ncbi:hypothetical protein [Streptomyces sulfonofaciens]|nr:hypothetical protein [Streptomyces sulfonofaciens]